MKIEASEKTVGEVLKANYFEIPRFQRPYSWGRDKVEEFWDDSIVDNPEDYFIGSMVLYAAKSGSLGIVDGQQRLTTITMILAAIRSGFEAEGHPDKARGIQRLIKRENLNDEEQYVVETRSGYPYFQTAVQDFGDNTPLPADPSRDEANVKNAYVFLEMQVQKSIVAIKADSTKSDKAKQQAVEDTLINIRDRILGLRLVWVELDNEDDAYIIFETLNTRGVNLRVSDLVKNLLARHIRKTAKDVDPVVIQWEKVHATIEGGSKSDSDVDIFLHHYWLSKYDYVSRDKLYKQIKTDIKESKAQAFLSDVVDASSTYRLIKDTSFGTWKTSPERQMRDSMDALSRFEVKQPTPYVLALMRHVDDPQKKLRPRQIVKSLQILERYHFLFTAITSLRSSGGTGKMYAKFARDLSTARTKQEKQDVIDEVRRKLKSRIPKKEEFLANWSEIVVTKNRTKDRWLVKYILSRILKQLYKALEIDVELMTIEHLLPQSTIDDDGVDEALVGQVGNLILVPSDLNKKLGQKSFERKREILIENDVLLDAHVKDALDWSRFAIESRTKFLGNLAYDDIWAI